MAMKKPSAQAESRLIKSRRINTAPRMTARCQLLPEPTQVKRRLAMTAPLSDTEEKKKKGVTGEAAKGQRTPALPSAVNYQTDESNNRTTK